MSTDGLDILDPQSGVARFRGEQLEVQPLTLVQLPRFSRLVRPVIAEFLQGRHPAWLEDDTVMVLELLELHGESIIEAAAIATGRPAEFIGGNRNAAELLDLARVIVEVNRDFFIQAMKSVKFAPGPAPSLPASADGQTPSSTLSAPAIH
ncbi:hypothetical protein MMG85_11805 [Pseudoxanthomonas sp. LH2527]|uniref:hypothetical protein n=1 Tax=Pseudoxanthomonas sp. LH2527 TaxID=2923249 RepID=UPI001F12C2D7|nr:hypothetical protein [Pseudoxanthomonas sp. LH2527]MCH6484242.1 hypothetical protein [Pseudoxanthomonas sp. LH2527]